MIIHISTDKALLDIAFIHSFLTSSYWSESIPEEIVRKSIEHSMCFGIYGDETQIGFARVVTDYCTFAYLADVFIDRQLNGQGHGKMLMQYIKSHKDLQAIKRWHLVTKDAQGLYRHFGFEDVQSPEQHMEITHPNIFRK